MHIIIIKIWNLKLLIIIVILKFGLWVNLLKVIKKITVNIASLLYKTNNEIEQKFKIKAIAKMYSKNFKMRNEGSDPTRRMRNNNPFFTLSLPWVFFVSVFVKSWGVPATRRNDRVRFFLLWTVTSRFLCWCSFFYRDCSREQWKVHWTLYKKSADAIIVHLCYWFLLLQGRNRVSIINKLESLKLVSLGFWSVV